MKKKSIAAWLVLAASAAVMVSGCSKNSPPPDTETAAETAEDTAADTDTATEAGVNSAVAGEGSAVSEAGQEDRAADYVDDFYDAVNHHTLSGWKIPADQSNMGWMRVTREENYKKVDAMIRQASSETGQAKGSDLYNIRAFNLTGLDREARDRAGYGQRAGVFLKEVDEAATVTDLLRAVLAFQREYSFYSLVGFAYAGDSEDSSAKVLYLLGPDTGLSREIWFSQDASNQKRVEEYKRYLTRLNQNSGMSRQDAEDTVGKITGMMKDLASASLTIEECYDAEKTYNVYTAKDAAAIYADVLPVSLLKGIYGIREDEKTVVEQPDLCGKLAEYLTEENLPLLKSYIRTCLYTDLSRMADTESLDAYQDYEKAANGVEEKKSFERTVSEAVQSYLGYQCGRLFCEQYFDENGKKDVTSIIHQVIEEYDHRLADMEWMTEATRQEARKKLAAIVIKVGYPDEWPQDRYSLELKAPEEGGLYMDNFLAIMKASQDYAFRTKDDPVDRKEWGMTPQTVNAYYNPGNNEIVFPAGILQPPFYDADAEPVVNLGRIGSIIGHEITHAFDTNGSQYDEKGNLRDWWTAGDKKKFGELAQKVVDYYNSMEVGGIKVNGKLTVTENIADLGGVSCVTEIARKKGYDMKELYKAYAVIWASKYREEYLSYIMTNDVHSPGITRVNAVLSATDAFYEAFDVKEGDGMYRKPEDRPGIW